MMSRAVLLFSALLLAPRPADAQTWNDADVLALVVRASARRAADQASGLEDFRARAHGFVFFLAQLGEEGFAEPPRLVKSDQLELEVYWNANGASKQRIIGWRDRVDLPTDIRYHRDHLGIVQNGFADRIRLGEGDEVRDVPHPLGPSGTLLYDFAVVDSLTMRIPGRAVHAIEVAFRPKDYDEPRIVGSMYLDAGGGELVQLRFNFTRAAYLDDSLEDITILLENALWDGRWWLPRRQEIEIRRRSTWLELPARGIIRGHWRIDGYQFNTGVAARVFSGPEIVVAPRAIRDTFPWIERLDAAIAAAVGPVTAVEMDEVRARVRDITGGRVLTGLPAAGLSFRRVSDLLHFNRVEGFAPGFGYGIRPGGGALTLRGWISLGLDDDRLKARLDATYRLGRSTIAVRLARELRDIGDDPVISPLLNSLQAQELGKDRADWVLLEEGGVALRRGPVQVGVGVRRSTSVATRATPAHGSFEPNPQLGSGTWGVGEVRLSAVGGVPGAGVAWRSALEIEGGFQRDLRFARVRAVGRVLVPAGATEFGLAGWGGWGSGDLPLHRAFVLGGRGTLVGEQFRAWGGRRAAWGKVEWRVPVPFPAFPLGAFASTGRQLVLAPYASVGWAGDAFPATPWTASGGVRAVLGVAVELFHRLLRADVGWSVRRRRLGVTVDLRQELWPIL